MSPGNQVCKVLLGDRSHLSQHLESMKLGKGSYHTKSLGIRTHLGCSCAAEALPWPGLPHLQLQEPVMLPGEHIVKLLFLGTEHLNIPIIKENNRNNIFATLLLHQVWRILLWGLFSVWGLAVFHDDWTWTFQPFSWKTALSAYIVGLALWCHEWSPSEHMNPACHYFWSYLNYSI